MATVEELLVGVRPGVSMASRNLVLFPLVNDRPAVAMPDYVTAAEAIEQGLLRITELEDGARVSEVGVVSIADRHILLLDGEELVGAMQNRVLNTDVFLRPRGCTAVPVSCVEAQRWAATQPDFEIGSWAPPMLRAATSTSVSLSLMESNTALSDQTRVWDEVGRFLTCMGVPSETLAMADAFARRRDDLEAAVGALRCPADAVGVVAVARGRFVALDLFAHQSTLQRVWRRLVTGYAAHAVTGVARQSRAAHGVDPTDLLDRIRQVYCRVYPGVDLGENWRLESSGFVGSALVVARSAMHLSVFPGDQKASALQPLVDRLPISRKLRSLRKRP